MKMCKPDQKDGDTAMRIMGIIDDIGRGDYPRTTDGKHDPHDPDYFDEDDEEHLRAFYDRIFSLYSQNPGALMRVIGGMVLVVMYEENEMIDPNSDTLDPHPKIVNALDVVKKIQSVLKEHPKASEPVEITGVVTVEGNYKS